MTDRKSDGRSKVAIGERLDLTRRALGLSQNDFARRAGVANNTLNQYIKGGNRPELDQAIKICDAYNLTMDWIYFGDPSGLRYELAAAIAALRAVASPDMPQSSTSPEAKDTRKKRSPR